MAVLLVPGTVPVHIGLLVRTVRTVVGRVESKLFTTGEHTIKDALTVPGTGTGTVVLRSTLLSVA